MYSSVDFQSLPTENKCLWLKSPEGIAQIKQWLSEGYTLGKIAKMLNFSDCTIYKYCDRIPELVAITGRTYKPLKNHSKPAAYRLISDLSLTNPTKYKHKRFTLREYPTAQELWADPFFDRYFASHHQSKDKYYTGYLKALKTKGLYTMSNTFSAAYCEITRKGAYKIIKQAL